MRINIPDGAPSSESHRNVVAVVVSLNVATDGANMH